MLVALVSNYLLMLMPVVCQRFVFWLGEGDRKEIKNLKRLNILKKCGAHNFPYFSPYPSSSYEVHLGLIDIYGPFQIGWEEYF
jgi:hypothetical protein